MPKNHILAIDQGTTSSRAIIFDQSLNACASAQEEFTQHFPQSCWVEHDPEDILRTVLETSREAIAKAGMTSSDLAAIGITNQRETTLIWDRATGKPVPWNTKDVQPDLAGTYRHGGTTYVPAFKLLANKYLADDYAPENVAERCGIG